MNSLMRLGRALQAAFTDRRALGLIAFTFTIIAGASVFYHYVEQWGWIDSVYFSVMTISTVGYGDFSPETAAGKIFTVGYVILGLGVFVAMATAVADAILAQRQKDRSADD
jgi:voltage-gated potassium channel